MKISIEYEHSDEVKLIYLCLFIAVNVQVLSQCARCVSSPLLPLLSTASLIDWISQPEDFQLVMS